MNSFIFDMDGVIFDTERVWKDAFEKANTEFQLDLDEEYRQSTCGKSEEQIQAELSQIISSQTASDYRRYMREIVANTIENGGFCVKDNFPELAMKLKSCGYKIALATSSKKARALSMFKKKGIDINSIFDATVFAEDVNGKSKPNPLIFQIACERLGENAESCYVVEDSTNGIEAAVNGNFVPIMVIDLIQPNEFCKKKAKKLITNLSELEELL